MKHIRTIFLIALTPFLLAASLLVSYHPARAETPPPELTPTATATVTAAPVVVAEPGEPVTAPDYLPVLISAVLVWLFTAGLKSLSEALPSVKNLEGQATAIAAALTAVIVAIVNAVLTYIPPEYGPLAMIILAVPGSILGAYGIAGTVKQLQPKTPAQITVTPPAGSTIYSGVDPAAPVQ